MTHVGLQTPVTELQPQIELVIREESLNLVQCVCSEEYGAGQMIKTCETFSPVIVAFHVSFSKALRPALIWYKYFFLFRKQTSVILPLTQNLNIVYDFCYLWHHQSFRERSCTTYFKGAPGFSQCINSISCIITYFYNWTMHHSIHIN